MPDPLADAVRVLIHPNQFPTAVEAALAESLRTRRMNHRFLYDTPKQTLRWLRLHEACSPARTDPDCQRIYSSAFREAAGQLAAAPSGQPARIELVSLGCGGGQKDAQLLRVLGESIPSARRIYVPVDVSVGLTLTSRGAALGAGLLSADIVPFVVDLGGAEDWLSLLAPALSGSGQRVICFFGMLPNFDPASVLARLSALVRPEDLLLVSANLAPGAETDYEAGVSRVLPLYENELTRDWLWSVLEDLGMERAAGDLVFSIESCPRGSGLRRIEANVIFRRACRITYAGRDYEYQPGERFGLFYSYRHTPGRLSALLAKHGLEIRGSWINASAEEGVFLCRRSGLGPDVSC